MKPLHAVLAALLTLGLSPATAAEHKADKAAAATPTPEDLQLFADIRRVVLKDETLSGTAKNCKIITAAGKVTLRGPVATSEEKAVIEKHARATAGTTSVDNQLEVKATK